MKALVLVATICAAQAAALTPDQERASFQLADAALTVELAAAEPNVVSPVAMTWDARGRMFVAEMIDYPIGPGFGQVRLLEDVNDDGFYDESIVFADQLAFPNGVLSWRDGILVTSAPNILFLRDVDGDGRADERRVMLTGFAEGNQQLRVNGLHWGLDGWVYGANGRSDGELRLPGSSRSISLRGHDFRFKPDSGEVEAIAGRSQFGAPHDDWGNRFLSWNTIAVRHEVIPERFLARNPNIALTEAVRDCTPEGDAGEVFPRTPHPQTFNNESTSHFNALSGLAIYRGDALPKEYHGNAFMGESLRNLVHRRVLEREGGSFVARRVEQGKEFLASTDPWFHPVNFATGPDGALYIADFYRQWVEHPGYVPEKLRDRYPWRTGAEHGRIWRVRPREWKRPALPFAQLQDRPARLLAHASGWWRDTAARLLIENREKADLADIREAANQSPLARVHALHLLAQWGALDVDTLRAALDDPHPRVREHAVRLCENRPELAERLVNDPDAAVRLWTALALGSWPGALASIASRADLDRVLEIAIRSSVNGELWPLLKALPRSSANTHFYELIHGLAFDAATRPEVGDEFKRLLDAGVADEKLLAVFSGLARGKMPASVPAEKLLPIAETLVRSRNASHVSKTHALQTLAHLAERDPSRAILSFLSPNNDPAVQLAAADALVEAANPSLIRAMNADWKTYSVDTRRRLLARALATPAAVPVMLEALVTGRISPLEVDPASRAALARSNPKAGELFGVAQSANRAAVVEKYSAALTLEGNAARGRELFEKNCAQCHSLSGSSANAGPSLSGIASRSKQALLIDLFDPNRQVNPEFLSYSVETADGETLTGLVVSESAASLTLRRPNAPDETIPRARIRGVQASAFSLMPEGLEASLTPQGVADLLHFLAAPAH